MFDRHIRIGKDGKKHDETNYVGWIITILLVIILLYTIKNPIKQIHPINKNFNTNINN